MNESRKLPVGIHDFEKLRNENYLYVDKTPFLYRMVTSGCCYFLSRPRFFGKTLFLSTLEAYFRGRRDLFEGLAIMALEDEWQEYTVLTLDFSTNVYTAEGSLENVLNTFLTEQEERYGRHEERRSYSSRFEYIIRRASETSGKPVVVLIDNYDKPVLDALFTPEETHNRDVLRDFYSALNGNDYYLKFVFMTGISKFASVNIFNGSNQFKDISAHRDFGGICGFTADEVAEHFQTEIEVLAADLDMAPQTAAEKLAEAYGGYRFVRQNTETPPLCNPFSLLNALDSRELGSFWFQTGHPAMLIKMLQGSLYDMFNIIFGLSVDADSLSDYKWTEDDLITMIYQCGYLTIRSYDPENALCYLALPNKEIRSGFLKALLPFYTNIGTASKVGAEIAQFRQLLASAELSQFMDHFSAVLKDIPALKKKKESPERIFQVAFHALLQLTDYAVRCPVAGCRTDIILETGSDAYIFILKTDKGCPVEDVIDDALARIEEKRYMELCSAGKTLHLVPVVFNAATAAISGWKDCAPATGAFATEQTLSRKK